MAKYLITDKAGRYVAGVRNSGVGTALELTDKQAEAALREGTIVAADVDAKDDKPAAKDAGETKKAAKDAAGDK